MNAIDSNLRFKQQLAIAEDSSHEVLSDLSQDSNANIRQAVANNLSAPEEVLHKLSEDSESEIRKAVAANPNTSQEILEKLSAEFPDAITANPVFDLLLLENPETNFLKLSLARSSTSSPEVLLKQH